MEKKENVEKPKQVWDIHDSKDAKPVHESFCNGNIHLARLQYPVNKQVSWIPYWLHFPFFYYPYAVNNTVARGVGQQVCIASIILGVLRLVDINPNTVAYCTAMIFAGYLIRFLWGGSYSLLGSTAGIVARGLEPDVVTAPPKQFAAFCGLLFSMAATIGMFTGPFYVGPIFFVCSGWSCWTFWIR